jgi:mannosyltransferase OCH1-like enzyme
MSDIPKTIHMVWNHKQVVDSQSPMILNGLRKIIDLNPDWELILYTPEEVELYLKDALDSRDYGIVRTKHLVSKLDIWRTIKIFNEGGVYTDIDRFCNISLSELASEGIKWVLPTYRDVDFSCDFIMSAPQNPALAQAAELYLQRRRAGHDNQYFLGPQTYMHAITTILCGQMIDSNPGHQVFKQIRETINQASFISTYREDPPLNTIIYRPDSTDPELDLETMKREFYASEGVKHWTGEW